MLSQEEQSNASALQNKALTIGELTKRVHCTDVTIRYYERCGLIKPTARSAGGYRLYDEQALMRLVFIINAKAVGFDLSEIKALLALQKNNGSSAEVKQKAQAKLREIDEKIAMLKSMKSVLSSWEQSCDGKMPLSECPILSKLYQEK